MKVLVIGEIGINHNGSIDIAKEMIEKATKAGCDVVKFQKRTVEDVYSKEFLDSYRESPWGTTQREQKEGLEFSEEEYCLIDEYCKKCGIPWFASAWDMKSLDFLRKFNLPYNKIASAMLNNIVFVEKVAKEGKKTFISTGMSTLEEIARAVEVFRAYNCPFELLHCNSSYPADESELNISVMETLKTEFFCDVGYSGHERGFFPTLCAVARGATVVERHLTLDKTMYGSDQKASIDMEELAEMVRQIRRIEIIVGDGKKCVMPSEIPIRQKLRGV